MNKRLLQKTKRVYLLFLIAVFIVIAPLFYIVSRYFYIENMDEYLRQFKTEFIQNTLPKLTEKDVAIFNGYNTNIQILAINNLKVEELVYTTYYNKFENENEPYRQLNTPILINGKPFTFSVKVNLVESEDLITSIALLFFVMILLLLIGLYIITNKLSVNLWKPFYHTLQQIENFEIDQHQKPQLTSTNIEEFSLLNKSIENLIAKNQLIFENQREFVENAAHELQTPIAIFKAKIDEFMQRNDITKGQAEILETISNTITRFNRLNKNLLLLSKIDKNQFVEVTNFSMKALIENQLEFFKEQAAPKNIQIEAKLTEDVNIKATKDLVEILCSNLFLNAISHNFLNGKITIHLDRDKLLFSNTGKAFALQEKTLFNRFSKTNESKNGNGLGLAIAKKISDLNDWTISYAFDKNLHIFSIKF
jgi:signal transduction histidine kinase